MDCENSGAPMLVVSGRDHLGCEYCSSVYFPKESRDGVKILGETSEFNCPVCSMPLVSASVAEVMVRSCSRCRGLLAGVGDFSLIVKYLRDHVVGIEEYRHRPLERKELDRDVRCPKCRREMNTHPYYGPGNIDVDNCMNCELIWLDYGELRKITHAAGRDRGQEASSQGK